MILFWKGHVAGIIDYFIMVPFLLLKKLLKFIDGLE